ncbi:hypothetical protein Tco_0304524, partial [Tanacetum coccineum]
RKNVVVMEMNSIVELLVRAVDDTEVEGRTEIDDCYSKKVCYKHRVD